MFWIFQKYTINFWLWWYIVENKIVLSRLVAIAGFTLGYFNIIPMLQNLFQPLYQDNTKMGRIIAFPIRVAWITFGTIVQTIITIPLIIAYVAYLIFPLLPFVAVLSYFVNL